MTEWEDRMDATRSRVAEPRGGLTVDTRHDADAVFVALAGELDLATAERARDALADAMDASRQRLIVDLSSLGFIDSSGLHALLDAYKRCRGAHPVLTIRPGPPNVQQVFELTNTLDYLPFESSR